MAIWNTTQVNDHPFDHFEFASEAFSINEKKKKKTTYDNGMFPPYKLKALCDSWEKNTECAFLSYLSGSLMVVVQWHLWTEVFPFVAV